MNITELDFFVYVCLKHLFQLSLSLQFSTCQFIRRGLALRVHIYFAFLFLVLIFLFSPTRSLPKVWSQSRIALSAVFGASQSQVLAFWGDKRTQMNSNLTVN